jgi:hypothetical protein
MINSRPQLLHTLGYAADLTRDLIGDDDDDDDLSAVFGGDDVDRMSESDWSDSFDDFDSQDWDDYNGTAEYGDEYE